MSPQARVLFLNYTKRFTTYVALAALAVLGAFFAQDTATQARQIARLGFDPVWFPLVAAVLHFVAGMIPQPSQIQQVPDASGNPPTPPSAG